MTFQHRLRAILSKGLDLRRRSALEFKPIQAACPSQRPQKSHPLLKSKECPESFRGTVSSASSSKTPLLPSFGFQRFSCLSYCSSLI